MGDIVYLVKRTRTRAAAPVRPPRNGSRVILEVERGQLRENLVNALNAEDASALLIGLAMALVTVIRATQVG